MMCGRPPRVTEEQARELLAWGRAERGTRGVMGWGVLRDKAEQTGLSARYLRHLLSHPPKRFEATP